MNRSQNEQIFKNYSNLQNQIYNEFIEKYSVDDWGKSPIPDYMDAYLNSKVLKDFIQKKIE